MKHILLFVICIQGLTSCMFLLPEGRKVSHLREQKMLRMEKLNQKQALLYAKRAEVEALRGKLNAALKARTERMNATNAAKIRVAANSSVSTSIAAAPTHSTTTQEDTETLEVQQLQRELDAKLQELNQLESEIYLSH